MKNILHRYKCAQISKVRKRTNVKYKDILHVLVSVTDKENTWLLFAQGKKNVVKCTNYFESINSRFCLVLNCVPSTTTSGGPA